MVAWGAYSVVKPWHQDLPLTGTVMTLMGIVQNFNGLLTARLFLGLAEAGLFPGVSYYITTWYVREECQFRQALFSSAAGVAGAFSGLLAFAIAVRMPDRHN